ncbi:MAG: Maf family protein [Desulfobacteraceae bacterium]
MDFTPVSRSFPLTLASASPRRRRLLDQVGIPHIVLPSETPEEAGEASPAEASALLACRKAAEAWNLMPQKWTLGADTMVVMDGEILGKPSGPEDARSMLQLLSGREHRVITGFGLLDPSGRVAHTEAVETLVRIRPLSPNEMEGYIHTGEPFGKAGSYAIQGVGAFMVEGITGSYTNVVGLPLCALLRAMLAKGALQRFPLESSTASSPRIG